MTSKRIYLNRSAMEKIKETKHNIMKKIIVPYRERGNRGFKDIPLVDN
jgi:hypothetical protein